jgi:hypothetical protein
MLELLPYVLSKCLQSLSENLLMQNRGQLSADLLPSSGTQTPHILVVESAQDWKEGSTRATLLMKHARDRRVLVPR